jgi:hypothetical protein
MMEVVLAVTIFALAAAGLGLGHAWGRGAPKTSCGAAECLPWGRCEECPMRARETSGETRP